MTPRFWFAGSHEEFTPSALLDQAAAAERAGFDGIGCSDHFAPWFPGGESGNAWVWLGAVGQITKLPIGTGVTPVVHRYHPGVIAQAFMSLEEMYPGRVFLGIAQRVAASCAEHDRPVGEIILQTGMAWAETAQQAIDGARRWKPTQLPSVYREDIHDPAEMQRLAEAELSDDEFAHGGFVVSADVEHHVSRLRELCELGPSVICTQLIGQADPHGTIATYGERVLPALRRSYGAER